MKTKPLISETEYFRLEFPPETEPTLTAKYGPSRTGLKAAGKWILVALWVAWLAWGFFYLSILVRIYLNA